MSSYKSVVSSFIVAATLGGTLSVFGQPPPRGPEERWGRRLPHNRAEWCHRCRGRGEVKRNWLGFMKTCPECKGTGYYVMRHNPPHPVPPPKPAVKQKPHQKPNHRPDVNRQPQSGRPNAARANNNRPAAPGQHGGGNRPAPRGNKGPGRR